MPGGAEVGGSEELGERRDVAGRGGPLLVTDPGAASLPRRFYRAVTLP